MTFPRHLSAALCLCALQVAWSRPASADDFPKAARACIACHTFEKNGASKIGPNLWGIYGQPAAQVPGFDKYGDDMTAAAASGLVWTRDNLAAYITDPVAFLKQKTGKSQVRTSMIARIRKDKDRDAIVAYLETLKD